MGNRKFPSLLEIFKEEIGKRDVMVHCDNEECKHNWYKTCSNSCGIDIKDGKCQSYEE